MKTLKLLILSSLISVMSFAQSKGSIVGHVVDGNNLPIPGAVIMIESLNMSVMTDFNGDYAFVGIANGAYELKSSCLGCKTLIKNVMVNGKTVAINFVLDSAVNDLDEVVLKGSNSKGQAKALNKQKSNFNITNIVAADQVGKFPDANIGDAVKRIPGIAVQNDQGEARNIIIRGMAPQLNSVTLNGERIPSAEGDNRNVQMDLIPSDMVQAVEVNKVLTSDMEADAIGGSVNLVTRKAGEKTRITLTGAVGQNPVRDTPLYNASAVIAGRMLNNKLGAVLSTSLQSNDFGSDNVEFEWDGDANGAVLSSQDIRRYDVKRVRQSAALNLDYKIDNNNTIFFNTVLNNRKDWENRYRIEIKDIAETAPGVYTAEEVVRETKGGTNNDARLEEQEIQKFALNGEHILFNSVKFNWKTNYSKASETRNGERYIAYKLENVGVTQDLSDIRFPNANPLAGSDFNNPAAFELDEISEENQYTEEKNYGAKFDLEIPMLKGAYENTLKVGYRYKNKEKSRDNNYYEYEEPVVDMEMMSDVPYSDKTVNGFLPGDKYKSGNFVNEDYLGGLDLNNENLFTKKTIFEEFVPVNYNAKEQVNAAYGMITQKLSPKLSALAGLRVERTDIDYTGYRIDIETADELSDATQINATKNYTNFLPNLQFKYSLNPNTIFRLAYSTSIARPNYYDLVPYQSINSDDWEFEEGNSDLEASYANNFDFMFEHYFSSVGIISGGVFYKNIDKFVYTYAEDGFVDAGYPGETFEYSQQRNGDKAKVYGIEVSVQRRLDFLPSFLKNLNAYLNYTYTDSEANGVEGRSKLALAGTVNNMFNASLAYETKKLTVRASLNYAGDYIDEYGDEDFEDIYYDEQMFLDVNATYEIFKGLRLFTEFKNLTNQELRYYQGKKDFTAQAEYYNFNWNAGVKYNF
ncbi:TonB-dependent receptor [Wenyingzhuangia sp. IMCC45467]